MTKTVSGIFGLLIVLQGTDVALHIATDQFEPIRIIASAALCIVGAVIVWRPTVRSVGAVLGGLIYSSLNFFFLLENGVINPNTDALRIPLFVFIVGSIALLVLLARCARPLDQPRRDDE